MQLIARKVSSIDLDSVGFLEIFIEAEVMQQLGYGRFDAREVQGSAEKIAQLPMLDEFFCAGYGVADDEPTERAARIYFMREDCRDVPDKRTLRKYRMVLSWADDQLLLDGRYLLE